MWSDRCLSSDRLRLSHSSRPTQMLSEIRRLGRQRNYVYSPAWAQRYGVGGDTGASDYTIHPSSRALSLASFNALAMNSARVIGPFC